MKRLFSISRPSSALFPMGLVIATLAFGSYFDRIATDQAAEAKADLHWTVAARHPFNLANPWENLMKSDDSKTTKADHGAQSEVTWNNGRGRQPYANQGAVEADPPGGGDEFSEGDRGELSGRTQQQSAEAAKKP